MLRLQRCVEFAIEGLETASSVMLNSHICYASHCSVEGVLMLTDFAWREWCLMGLTQGGLSAIGQLCRSRAGPHCGRSMSCCQRVRRVKALPKHLRRL